MFKPQRLIIYSLLLAVITFIIFYKSLQREPYIVHIPPPPLRLMRTHSETQYKPRKRRHGAKFREKQIRAAIIRRIQETDPNFFNDLFEVKIRLSSLGHLYTECVPKGSSVSTTSLLEKISSQLQQNNKHSLKQLPVKVSPSQPF